MNKLFLISSIIFLLNLNTKAQLSNFIVGGTIGYGTSNTKFENSSPINGHNESTSLSGSPYAGYYIYHKVMTGLAIDFVKEYPSNTLNSSIKSKYSEVFLDPFIRYFFNRSLFIQAQFNFGKSIQKFEADSVIISSMYLVYLSDLEYSVIGFGLGVGYDIEINDYLILEPMIRYVNNHYTNKNNDYNFIRTNVLIKMGLNYIF